MKLYRTTATYVEAKDVATANVAAVATTDPETMATDGANAASVTSMLEQAVLPIELESRPAGHTMQLTLLVSPIDEP